MELGLVVPMPTLPLPKIVKNVAALSPTCSSSSATPRSVEVVILKAEFVVPPAARAEVRFNTPAEVKASVPLVAVEMVRLPEVLVQAEVPPEAKVKAPLEFPILVAEGPVAVMLVVPVTVNPPVP